MAQANTTSKFMQPLEVSESLAAVIGKGPMPRTEVFKKVWAYIKANDRQDPNKKRFIIPDDKLAKVFGNSDPIDMFQMTRVVNGHLKAN